MKKILLMLLVFFSSHLFAQTVPNFDIIKLEKVSDFKAAEPFALQTANYLLTTPFVKESEDRLKSLQFLVKWMGGTPDYSFIIDESATKITKGNNDLLTLYMAAMTKYTLENKEAAKTPATLRLNSVILLLDYCENKKNNIKLTKQLKKLSEARAKGELEQAL